MLISDWSSDVCSSDLDRVAIVSRGGEPSSSAKAKFPRSRASTHHAARAGPLNPFRPTCGIIARSFSAQLEFYVLDFLISPAFAQQAAATSPQIGRAHV